MAKFEAAIGRYVWLEIQGVEYRVYFEEAGQGIPARGCRFRTRCPVAIKQCETDDPILRKLPDGSAVACHLA